VRKTWDDDTPSDWRRVVDLPGGRWSVERLGELAGILMRGNVVRIKGGATIEADVAVRWQLQPLDGGIELIFDSQAGGVTQPILTLPNRGPCFVSRVQVRGRRCVAVRNPGGPLSFTI
jgi:hypothetical protein